MNTFEKTIDFKVLSLSENAANKPDQAHKKVGFWSAIFSKIYHYFVKELNGLK